MRTDINHRGADTTGINEGYHSSTKAFARASGSEHWRLDKLIWWLLTKNHEVHSYKDVRRFFGAGLTTTRIAI